jgi:hypothetical protein
MATFPKPIADPRIQRIQRYADIMRKGAITPYQIPASNPYMRASIAPAIGQVAQGMMAGAAERKAENVAEKQRLARILIADPEYRAEDIARMGPPTQTPGLLGAVRGAFMPQSLSEEDILAQLQGMSQPALEATAGYDPAALRFAEREQQAAAAKASKGDRSAAFKYAHDAAMAAGLSPDTPEYNAYISEKMPEYVLRAAGGAQHPLEAAMLKLDTGLIKANDEAVLANRDVVNNARSLATRVAPKYDSATGLSKAGLTTSAATPFIQKILRIGDALGFLTPEQRESLGELEAFKALVSFLVPRMRPVGSGSTSNFEVEMFEDAVPALENTTEGNQLIAGFFVQNLDYQARVNVARKRYMREHGNLDEFDNWLESEIEKGNFKSNVTNYQRADRSVIDDIREGKIKEGEVYINKDGEMKVMNFGRVFKLQKKDGSKWEEDLPNGATWQQRKDLADKTLGGIR